MQFNISGVNTTINSVTFSEKGFNKYLDDSTASYSLVCDTNDFISRFGPIYTNCIAELMRDDDITGEFHPPYAGATNYPSLEEFLCLNQTYRMEMIDTYFVFDILRLYLQEDIFDATVQWFIKSIDLLLRDESKIVIEGRVLQLGCHVRNVRSG